MNIAVYGPTGSGKTTIAHGIGEILDLPVIELDALFHRPNWQPTPDEEFRAKVRSALDASPRGWVCDGNYRAVRDIVLPHADAVVWLRLPFRTVYWRLFKRTVTRGWKKQQLWGTNTESLRMAFLSKDSILLWGITHWRAHVRNVRHSLATIAHQATVHELRSDAEVAAFLAKLRGRGEPNGKLGRA